MNRRGACSAAFTISLSVMAAYLTGCDECRERDSPCSGKAGFLMCHDDFESSKLRWHEKACPGVEPVCVDLPDNQHRCDDQRPPARCAALRTLPAPLLAGSVQLQRVADLDADGRMDLLLYVQVPRAPFGIDTALVRVMQDREGNLGAPIEILPRISENDRAFVADLDADKRLDLVETTSVGSELTMRLGLAGGSFAAPITAFFGAQRLFDVSDVDSDGIADLIAGTGDSLLVLDPLPNFTPRAMLRVAVPSRGHTGDHLRIDHAIVRDLDGDGRPELIAFIPGPRLWSIQVFTRSGDEWMADARPWATDEHGRFEQLGDFDNDGIADLISTVDPTAVRPRIFVATGDGAGKFRKREARQLPEGGFGHVGDFDGDGNLDSVSIGQQGISVLRGRGDGSLEEPQSFVLNLNRQSLVVADFDGDGASDVIDTGFGKVFVAPRACLP